MPDASTTLDLRELGCQQRHGLVFQCLSVMEPGQTLAFVNDHDPEPLRRQVAARFPGQFDWSLERPEPGAFRVILTRRVGDGA